MLLKCFKFFYINDNSFGNSVDFIKLNNNGILQLITDVWYTLIIPSPTVINQRSMSPGQLIGEGLRHALC